MLGGRVRNGMGARRMGRDRSIIDNAPATRVLFFHQAKGALRTQEGAGQVDVDGGLPLFVVQFFQRYGTREDACIVEPNIQEAKMRSEERRVGKECVRK